MLNGHGEFAFDDHIPKPGPEIFIKRLKGKEAITCTVLGQKIVGVWCHWNPKGNCSEPHYKDPAQCPGCVARRNKRWKGYLHCFCHEMGQDVFLEFTPHSAGSLSRQLPCNGSFRGNRFRIERSKGENGRLMVAILTAVQTPDSLPKEKNPQASILKLWGYEVDDDGHWIEPAP